MSRVLAYLRVSVPAMKRRLAALLAVPILLAACGEDIDMENDMDTTPGQVEGPDDTEPGENP